MTERSELDEFAVRMESAVDRFLGDRPASTNFVEIGYATDETVGDYPQAKLDTSRKYYKDDGDSYKDRFPEILNEPIGFTLKRSAKWTDVLSSELWSEGYLLNEKALAVFRGFDLGRFKTFEAEVRRGKDVRKYAYLWHLNHVSLEEDLDFERCEFYLADMLGSPKRMIDVASLDDFQAKRQQATMGEFEGGRKFDRIAWKTVRFCPGGAPTPALFGLGKIVGPTAFVRRELYDALKVAGVTGLEFKRNLLLFE